MSSGERRLARWIVLCVTSSRVPGIHALFFYDDIYVPLPPGLIVQGWITHDPTQQADTYEPVTCTACSRVHWVNPKTRKVLDKK